ncbi:aldo/keto reductase [Chloroflexota bacterium]
MIYKMLGRTGLEVSIIGFGASPLGNEFGAADPAEGMRAVRYAIEQGINYFDVSPYYGRTLAETRLGEALEGYRNEVFLATKAGRYGQARDSGFDFSAERIRRSVEESLVRLKTDWIDVFQVHDIEYGQREQIVGETLPEMFRLKDAGKVRFVGITGYPLGILRDVAEAVEVDTILSYCRYNLMDTAMDDVLAPLAKRQGIGLINASPLHMRVMTEEGAPDWHPAPHSVQAMGRRVAEYCRSQGMDVAELALQFVLQHDDVATTLVGMSKVRSVERNVRSVGRKPDPEVLSAVLKLIKPVANVCWREGRPENDDPGAVEKRS